MSMPDFANLNPALLVIDPQRDFVTLGTSSGAIVTDDSTNALANIAKLIRAAHDLDLPVIFTQEVHREEGVDFGRELDDGRIHCIEGTAGVDFHPATKPSHGDFIVPKRRYSGFFATDLDLLLRGLGADSVLICGFVADVCVHYTAVDAHQYGYHVFLASDATAGTTAEATRATMSAVDYLQGCYVVRTRELIEKIGTASKLATKRT